MRWFKRALLAVAAMVLFAIAGIFALNVSEEMQIARFYNAHPMLREMNKLPTTTDPRMTEILLARIPIGSTRLSALQTLSAEGLACEANVFLQRKQLTCRIENREPEHLIPRWYVGIQLDEEDKVSGGGIRVSLN